jgi:hypothetical protein
MKARYANRRPYADWLKTNTVSIGEVVATAPSAMAPQLLGVPATSKLNPDPKSLAAASYSSASNGCVLQLAISPDHMALCSGRNALMCSSSTSSLILWHFALAAECKWQCI